MDTSPDVPLFQNVTQVHSTQVHVTVRAVRHITKARASLPSADLRETQNYVGELQYGI